MSFWQKPNKKEAEPAPLPLWDQAKLITSQEAHDSALPLGWYIYQEDQLWYGMMPKGDRTGHTWSTPAHTPQELESWLGTAIPEIAAPEAPASPRISIEDEIRLAKEMARSCHRHTQMPEEPRAEPIRKRSHRLSARMNDREFKSFLALLDDCGKTQQTYIMEAIRCYSSQNYHQQLLDEIHALALDLNCEVQLLKEALKGAPRLKLEDPADFKIILEILRSREDMKRELTKLMEVAYGHR